MRATRGWRVSHGRFLLNMLASLDGAHPTLIGAATETFPKKLSRNIPVPPAVEDPASSHTSPTSRHFSYTRRYNAFYIRVWPDCGFLVQHKEHHNSFLNLVLNEHQFLQCFPANFSFLTFSECSGLQTGVNLFAQVPGNREVTVILQVPSICFAQQSTT